MRRSAPLFVLLLASAAGAGEADVLGVKIDCDAERVCRIAATVRHNDVGWDHYVDRFEVVAPGGRVLATRVLRHPHVGEQPFERAVSEVRIPEGVSRVVVRAHDSVHALGGLDASVEIPE